MTSTASLVLAVGTGVVVIVVAVAVVLVVLFVTASMRGRQRRDIGKTYRIEMQPPEGDPFYLTGEFREVDPPVRLAYTFVWRTPIRTT